MLDEMHKIEADWWQRLCTWLIEQKEFNLGIVGRKRVMKCESCGQEKPKARLFPGDIVEIDTACIWAGLAVITKVDYSKPSPFYLIPFTGRYKGIEGSFVDNQLEKIHGYVHINRTEMDYTRHAL